MKQLWTFHVRQGESFAIQVKGNPVMRHDGKVSLLKCLCTEQEAETLEKEMIGHGCQVEKHCPHEDAKQKEQREHVLSFMGDGRSFPCEKCPECSWFDPSIEGLCGAGMFTNDSAWENKTIEQQLSDKKFRQDWETCPLNTKILH